MEFDYSKHVQNMLLEREIPEDWIRMSVESPDMRLMEDDGTVHYIKSIVEYDGQFLRMVVNPEQTPMRIVTFFFDRGLGRNG
jgi:hypothetical protein